MSIIDGYAQEMRRKKQKPTKIYVVTCGTYSDYHIKGIFSSKAKANAYIKKYEAKEKFWDTPEIEEWILDEKSGFIWRTAYCEEVDIRYKEQRFRAWTYLDFAEPTARSKKDYRVEKTLKEQNFIRFKSYVSAKHAHDLVVKELQKRTAEEALLNGEI